MNTTIDATPTLQTKAQYGIQYLINHIREDGSFVYEQNARTGTISGDYNILRHAGSLFVLYQYLHKDPAVPLQTTMLLDKATGYLLKQVKPLNEKSNALAVFEKHSAKLGGAALTLLVLVERYRLRPEKEKLPMMRKLASFIVWMQQPSGMFRSKWDDRRKAFGHFESGYYPGQAIYALASLYAIDPDHRWLDASQAGAEYLIQHPVKENGIKVNNHWLSYGIVLLYGIYKDKRLYDELNDLVRICLEEIDRRLPHPMNPPPDAHYASAWATFGETLIAAIDLERRLQNLPRVQELLPHACRVAEACLHLQIGYHDKAYKYYALGGIRENEKKSRVRIDFVQHVVSVIMGLTP